MNHNISISKYNHLVGSSYIELTKQLKHAKKKGLIIFRILLTINDLNGI